MTPRQIANSSALVRSAYQELHQVASSLEKQEYRAIMSEVLTKPRLTFMTDLYRTPSDRKALFDEMVETQIFHCRRQSGLQFPIRR